MLSGKFKKVCAALFCTVLLNVVAVPEADAAESQQVTPNQQLKVNKITGGNFTGAVWLQNLYSPHLTSAVYAAAVTFEPGARTKWHIHPAGQSLIVTAGVGYTQEWGKELQVLQPGDVVWCPPGVKHWHGAAPDTMMTHIAISERTGQNVEWLEEVRNPFTDQK